MGVERWLKKEGENWEYGGLNQVWVGLLNAGMKISTVYEEFRAFGLFQVIRGY
jgi:hypothetical protein